MATWFYPCNNISITHKLTAHLIQICCCWTLCFRVSRWCIHNTETKSGDSFRKSFWRQKHPPPLSLFWLETGNRQTAAPLQWSALFSPVLNHGWVVMSLCTVLEIHLFDLLFHSPWGKKNNNNNNDSNTLQEPPQLQPSLILFWTWQNCF